MTTTSSRSLADYPADVASLVFEELQQADDVETLNSISITCRSLHTLSLPYLLRSVNLSSHNDGRKPELEHWILPRVYADFSDEYRPANLVSRQRAFLRLITERPDYARYVQSFAWTLIWMDFDDEELTDTDRELWNVFSRLINVSRLDIASIHMIWREPFIRQNPSKLFPAITDLRIVGWMHRGLVDAILTSLSPSALVSLKLDYFQDEGALPRAAGGLEQFQNLPEFPSGFPISDNLIRKYAHTYRDVHARLNYRETIDLELYKRQESGEACIFPGPMWHSLRLLSTFDCSSLSNFELRLARYELDIDLRGYFTFFDEAARFLVHIKDTLKRLTLVFADRPYLHTDPPQGRGCGTSRVHRVLYRRENITLVTDFLRQLVSVFNQATFPLLTEIKIEGFHILETEAPLQIEKNTLDSSYELLRNLTMCCSAKLVSFITSGNIDHRPVFTGYDCYSAAYGGLDGLGELFQ